MCLVQRKSGARGIQGEKGDKGEKGDARSGLTMKKFEKGKIYKKGDYVFAKSSKGKHKSMFIVDTDEFTAEKDPAKDKINWIEFHAPHYRRIQVQRRGKTST